VGRARLTGCALHGVGPDGVPVAEPGCPVPGSSAIVEEGNAAFRDTPEVADARVKQSHVQRVNHHVRPSSARNTCPSSDRGTNLWNPRTRLRASARG
jgi:deferrochelatase/peroxidase EfeB